MSNSSIWRLDRTLSGAITLGQCGAGRDGNGGVPHIPQRYHHYWSLMIRLFSFLSRTLMEESYHFVEMQSMYSITPGDCANKKTYSFDWIWWFAKMPKLNWFRNYQLFSSFNGLRGWNERINQLEIKDIFSQSNSLPTDIRIRWMYCGEVRPYIEKRWPEYNTALQERVKSVEYPFHCYGSPFNSIFES